METGQMDVFGYNADAGSTNAGLELADLIAQGADFFGGLTPEQKDELLRQYTQHIEAERQHHERQARISFEQPHPAPATSTPTHQSFLPQQQNMSSPSPVQSAQQQSSQQPFGSSQQSASVPHTPLKPYDSAIAGLSASALSTPSISTGSLSMANNVLANASGVDCPSQSALHVGSPLNAQQFLANATDPHMLLIPGSSLLSVHAPSPAQLSATAHPPPPPPSTPTNAMLGITSLQGCGAGAGGQNGGQGQLTMAFANALAQAALERGVDPSTLVQLLQSPKLMDVLLSKAGDLQQHQASPYAIPQPPPPPPPKPSPLQPRLSAPSAGEWSQHHQAQPFSPLASVQGAMHSPYRVPPPPPPPPPPRPSPAAAAAAALGTSLSVGAPSPAGGLTGTLSGPVTPLSTPTAHSSSNGGALPSASSLGGADPNAPPGVQQMLNSHMVQEFVSTRGVLVQLMLSAYAFLNSESMHEFYEKLAPVAQLYDEMHELPVVQKRQRCLDMSYMRLQLMADLGFTQILHAVCALRHHLHSLSRKVLVMNHGPEGVPIDLLLGSMSTELHHVMKGVLPQEVSDFFTSCLPHPRLAVLVFAEFTAVEPIPVMS